MGHKVKYLGLKSDKKLACRDASRYVFVKTSHRKNKYFINDVAQELRKAYLSENNANCVIQWIIASAGL